MAEMTLKELRTWIAGSNDFIGTTEITLSLDDWQKVRTELVRLAKKNRILEAKNAGTLANN